MNLPPVTSLVADPNQDPRENPSLNRTSAKFHPLLITRTLIRVLQFCFSQMPNPDYKWDPDPLKSALDIRVVNDTEEQTNEGIQKRPRIIVSRGSYTISETGLNKSMSEEQPVQEAKGSPKSRFMHVISGNFSIIIEANKEGTVEMLTDMVATFLTWSSNHICNTFGFNKFGLPLFIGEPALDKEDVEKFKVVINGNYLAESHFKIAQDGYRLAAMNLETVIAGS